LNAAAPADQRLSLAETRSSGLLLVSLVVLKIVIQFAGINQYGFFRDEFYYMACGRHLAWGYVDQPPLIALIAWIVKHTLGDSMFAIRLLPVLAGAAVVYITGRVTRELGGGLFAQFLAASAILFAPIYLAFDSFFSMNAFEPLIWLVCAWIAIRIVKGGSPKLWVLFGVVSGIGLQNKHTMLAFGFALVAGLLFTPARKVLASRWLWLGGAIAFAIFLPNLIWEATHGWPQIEVVRNGQAFKINHITPFQFLFEQVLFMQPVALPIWLTGLYWYFLGTEGRKLRFLGWTYLFILAIVMLLDGKSYYVVPIYPVLMASGGVAIEKFFIAPKRNWARAAYAAILILAGAITLPFGVPLLSINNFIRFSNALPYARSVKTERDTPAELPQLYADMLGWPNQAKVISNVYYAIPANERAGCAILAGNYGEAGAIDYYGKKYGLPNAISGHNSHYFWGPGHYSGDCMIIYGDNSEEYIKLFGESTVVATINSLHATPGEQNLKVYLCRKPIAPLSELWPHFKMII
jgi:Dolichyl-phosphate-mannose-protein mannosyltransferase